MIDVSLLRRPSIGLLSRRTSHACLFAKLVELSLTEAVGIARMALGKSFLKAQPAMGVDIRV
jgi:hypothetical protein